MKRYLSASEVAEELEVSRNSVHKWIKEGKIRAAKTPGGHNKIPRSELDRLKQELGYDLEERS